MKAMVTDPPGPIGTPDGQAEQLYAKREKIFPREVHGLFAVARTIAAWLLLGGFYGAAWINWNGQQIILWDLPARRFHLLGITFFPQDFILVAGLLIVAALALFFFTALAGRLWCGYACPQTVWTESFLWMERLVEGGRQKQMKLDEAPWNLRKIRIKASKHLLWLLFAGWTGFSFVGYFVPIRELAADFIALQVSPWALFWTGFYGFATYLNAGWMREQVCIYMCPYARFQSAMFDSDTLIISYDQSRGDPRGSRRRGTDPAQQGLGHCIDCTLCVQVCPTGIDIRNGLQYQCIGCAGCVDICDQVMEKMGYPKGLVSYTTERAMAGGRLRVLRPRILLYGLVLLMLVGAIGAAVWLRVPLELDVIRDRHSLYRETSEGMIENVYTLRLINMDPLPRTFTLAVDTPPGITQAASLETIRLEAYEVGSFTITLQADPADLIKTNNHITFSATSLDDAELTTDADSRFIGPGKY